LKAAARENRVRDLQRPLPVKPGKRPSNFGREFARGRRSAAATDWDKWAEEIIRNYCRCCHRAALDRMADAYRSGTAPPRQSLPEDLPIKPYRPGQLDAVYRLEWPGVRAGRLPQLADDKLRLYYLHAEHRTKWDPLLAVFRRQMKSLVEHPFADGLWLDSLVEAAKGTRLQSLDVLIVRTNTDLSLPGNAEQGLTVEILYIDVPNLRP
jgi:hypothetical protein